MSVKNLFSVLLLFFTFITSQNTYSEINIPEITLKASDTLALSGDTGVLSIHIDNHSIEVFGFQFVLKSNRPDIVTFDFSGLGYNVNGTLIENFEYIQVIDRAGDQSEYWFRCIADFIGGGTGSQSGILPQQGGIALRIPFIVNDSIDPNLSFSSELTFEIPTDFSDPFGNSIGAIPDTLVDTIYYNCLFWDTTTCTTWVEVIDTSLGYEFIYYDSSTVGLLDSTIVQVFDGSISILLPFENNCDLDGDGEIDITDLVYIVACMFQTGSPLNCDNYICDFDLNGITDISDLVDLVEFMFSSGPPPPKF